jgi:hypothetical protein
MSYWVKEVELLSNRIVALVFTLACASVVRAQSGALVQAWRYNPQKHLVENPNQQRVAEGHPRIQYDRLDETRGWNSGRR